MEQRAFGLLCEELLERHDGSDTPLLDRVREAARLAAAESPAERPGFSALAKLLVEDGTGADGPIAPPIGRALRRGGGDRARLLEGCCRATIRTTRRCEQRCPATNPRVGRGGGAPPTALTNSGF